jgi:hypothetical protein
MATLRVNEEFIKRKVFESQQYVLFMSRDDLALLSTILDIKVSTFWEDHNGNDEIDRENFHRLVSLAKELLQAFKS